MRKNLIAAAVALALSGGEIGAQQAVSKTALPTGGRVVGGQASISQSGAALTIQQSTPRAAINWQSFNIGASGSVVFSQPSASSVALNRVVGADPSQIFGRLSSNGQVFLTNPNGILFARGAQVDVGGLLASTLSMTTDDFLSGRYLLRGDGASGSIINQGTLRSLPKGYVALIAPNIQNEGVIEANRGTAALVAANAATVDFMADGLIRIRVDEGALNAEIANSGAIRANGGEVLLTAKALGSLGRAVVNNSGVIEARTAEDVNGVIRLGGGEVYVDGRLDAGSDTGGGGSIKVLGDKVALIGTAQLDASGETGGGEILVGGNFQGKGPETNATHAYVGRGVSIDASAKTTGDGGKVIVWADDVTRAYGTISARGGAQSGNGGFVEVSGKNYLDYQGIADLSSPNGRTGSLLLDPMTVEITASTDSGPGSFGGGDPNPFTGSTDGFSEVAWTTIAANLATADVNITTSGGSPAGANITVSANSPVLNSSRALRLIATQDINVNGSITNSGSGAIEMYAGWDGNSPGGTSFTLGNPGTITITAPITAAGSVLLRAQNGITDSGITTAAITTPNLLASVVFGSVILNSSTHMVDVLAGNSNDEFLFKNGKSLDIGTVGGINGIDVVAPSGLSDATINVLLTSGSLNVTQPIVATASETAGIASVVLTAPAGITVNNTAVIALGGDDTAGNGAVGGAASVQMLSGGDLQFIGAAAAVQASGGATPNDILGTPGTGTVTLWVTTGSGNPAPSGDITVQTVAADNVELQQNSVGASKSILRASGTSLITANQLLLEVDDLTDVGAGGSIGTSAAPIRVQVGQLEAHTHEASPGIFIDSPSAGLLIGGVSFFSGSVKGVQNVTSGDISITTNGTLSLQSGTAGCGATGGTGGPICTTGSGTITLTADSMFIDHIVSTSGIASKVVLRPATTSVDVNIELSPLSGLSLSPTQLQNVTAETLEIGRSDGTGNLNVLTPINSTDVNASTLRLLAGGNVNTSFGADIGGAFDHHLELRAGNNATVSGNIFLADHRHLVIAADDNNSGAGDFNSGAGTQQVGTTSSNIGSMTISGMGLHKIVSGGGTGSMAVMGSGAQSFTATGNEIRFENQTSGTLAITTDTGTQTFTTTGANGSGNLIVLSAPSASGGSVTVAANAGAQVVNLAGGLRVETPAGGTTGPQGAGFGSPSQNGQSITAKYVEVLANGQSTASIMNASGVQSITTTGMNASNEGLVMRNNATGSGLAFIQNNGAGAQTITVNNADYLRVSGVSGDAFITSSGDQTIQATGTGLNAIQVGLSGNSGGSYVSGSNQIVTAGTGIQSGSITLVGPVVDSRSVFVNSNSGTQTISTTGALALTGGTAPANGFGVSMFSGGTGLQHVSANSISLSGGTTGTNNGVFINNNSSSLGGQQLDVGSGGLTLLGSSGSGGSNYVQITQSSLNASQTINMTGGGSISITGGANGTDNSAGIFNSGLNQTLNMSAGGNLVMQGGSSGTLSGASVFHNGSGTQTLLASATTGISLTGGSGTANNSGAFLSTGSPSAGQVINAGSGGILIDGGSASGGASGAGINQGNSAGFQTITVNAANSGSVSLLGSTGSVNDGTSISNSGTSQTIQINDAPLVSIVAQTGNAGIFSTSNPAATQTITIQGATSANALVIGNAASAERSSISGRNQTVTVGTGAQAGSITIQGGVTANRGAGIFNNSGNQDVSTPGTISLTGGTASSGGIGVNCGDAGSCAQIGNNSPSGVAQSITAHAISALGGSSGDFNQAGIYNNGSTLQTVTINGAGGSILLVGGSGGGRLNSTYVGSGSTSQLIDFTASGGSITLTGGTVGNGNFASVGSGTGLNQTITGRPSITLTGGANGGILDEANFAGISTGPAGVQSISSASILLNAGAGGGQNFATINAPTQTIDVLGTVTLIGGGSANNAGARIGGRGVYAGGTESATNLTLTTTGDITLTGGAVTGAAIGSSSTGTAQINDITINGGGNITLTAGAGSGVRIGASSGLVAGGNISVDATGNLSLTGNATNQATVQTNGNITLGATDTITVQDSIVNAGGTLDITATNNLNVIASTAASNINSSGLQTISVGGITVQGAPSGTNLSAQIYSTGGQSITAGANGISISGGDGTGNYAKINQDGASALQTISTSGGLIAQGGGASSGSGNSAFILQNGSGLQHVTANLIDLMGGGGATGTGNGASINTGTGSTASQQVDIGSGGLVMQGGTGSAGQNKAGLYVLADFSVNSGTVATQVINVTGGGSIQATGGSNALNSPAGNTNNSGIYAAATGAGSSQTVAVSGSGGISLTGGPSGIGNLAYIQSLTPIQTVTAGSGGIALVGDGGATGTNDKAMIFQQHATGTQSITVNGGGSIAMTGGTGDGGSNGGQILSNGTAAQSIIFTAPGSLLSLTAGTGSILSSATSANFVAIEATGGSQTIAGSITANNPNITMTGGASGGASPVGSTILGNNAIIRAPVGPQTISAGSIQLDAGAGGIDSSATIQAPTQTITASSVSINGGGTTGGFAGARIGGIGGFTPGPTNLSLTTTTGDVTLTGGSGSGVSIGSNSAGGVITDIIINSGGDVTLASGTGGGARIGSPGSNVAGGNISVNAAGNLSLTGNATFQPTIRTNDNITLGATNQIALQDATVNAGGTLTVGAGGLSLLANTGAALLMSAGTQSITVNSGGLTLTGAGGSATNNGAQIVQTDSSATQSITVDGGGNITLNGGAGSGNSNIASIDAYGTAQTITFDAGGNLALTGGTVGTNNFAMIRANNATPGAQTQTISGATGMSLTGGASGGGIDGTNIGLGNFAQIRNSNGSQSISADGITLTGGGGAATNNFAMIIQGTAPAGSPGTSQTITINNGGVLELQGGSSALTNVIGGTSNPNNFFRGSFALLESNGDSQSIAFSGGGAINLTGGTVGSNNVAEIFSRFGVQTISGAPSISLTGGASGGAQNGSINEGNFALIVSNGTGGTQSIAAGAINMTGGANGTNNAARIINNGFAIDQTISATGITMTGGADGGGINTGNSVQINSATGSQTITVGSGGLHLTGGGGSLTQNFASIFQGGLGGTSQNITVNGGGSIVLQGGSSAQSGIGPTTNGSYAFITADGNSQNVNFIAGGALSATGGTVGSRNNAGMQARNGGQTITGSPNITLTGGPSGGFDQEGNFAGLLTSFDLQSITAGNVTLNAGAGGVNNFATIQGPWQEITVNGNLAITGGGSVSGPVHGGGAGIGGRGGLTPTDTNLTLNVSGNVTLVGGSVANSGASIGSGFLGAQRTDITLSAGGNITLSPGTAAGARIGSPASAVADGMISVTAGGDIALNSSGGIGTSIRTLENVTLHADAAGKSISQGVDSVIQANTLTATANSGITLIGNNLVTHFNASNSTANGIQFTSAAGTLLTVTGISQSGGDVIITADDLDITGGISAGANTVILRPTTLAQNINLENSPSGGVLSLSPNDISNVTAGTLEIGRNDNTGTGGMTVTGFIVAPSAPNADTVRLFAKDIVVTGATIGNLGAPFNNLEVRATDNLTLNGNSFAKLADGKSLTLVADNDLNLTGNLLINGANLQVGSSGINTGAMSLSGQNVTVQGGPIGTYLQVSGSGAQTITAANQFSILGAASGSSGNANVQTSTGLQTVTANGILLQAGAGGSNNWAYLQSNGGQNITAGAGGITLLGGGGAGSSQNFAQITQSGLASNQIITINGGGNLTIQGGSGSGSQNKASIDSQGASQQINFGTPGSAIVLTGGANGIDNYAELFSDSGNATISGSPNITLQGGPSGGAANQGNSAEIIADNGMLTVAANNLSLIGGAGTEAAATISGSTVNVTYGGTVQLSGGSGVGAVAAIGSNGNNIAITLTGLPGSGGVTLTGGTGGVGSFGLAADALIGAAGGFNADVTVNSQGNIALIGGGGPGFGRAAIGSDSGGGTVILNAGVGGTGNLTLTNAQIGTTGNVTMTATGNVVMQNASVDAALLTLPGSGSALFNSGTVDLNATVNASAPVNIGGATVNFNGASSTVDTLNFSGGTLSGSGDLTVNGAFNWSTAAGASFLSGSGTFTTAGTSTLSGTSLNSHRLEGRVWNNTGVASLTGAHFSLNSGATFNNSNTFNVTTSSPIGMDSTGVGTNTFNNSGVVNWNTPGAAGISVMTAFNNTGTVNVNGGTMNVMTGAFSQTGTINVGSSTILRRTGGFTNAGVIQGVGAIDVGAGNTLINNGAVRPGGAAVVGTLAIAGNYAQGSGGSLDVDLASGPSYDVLAVSGSAALNGTLNVNYLGGYTGTGGDHLVMNYASRTGTFTTINDANALPPNYGATTFSLGAASAIDLWINPLGGDWSVGSNWSLGHAPGALEVAQIPDLTGAPTITLASGTHTPKSLVFLGDETFSLSGGLLTFANPSSISNGTLSIAGGTMTANSTLTTKNLHLSAGGLTGSGSVTVTGGYVGTGGSINLGGALSVTQASGNLVIGNPIAAGSLSLTAPTGAILQTAGALSVTGAANFNAGAGAITLTSAGNDFAGAVTLGNSGANPVQITDANAIVLAASTVGQNLTVNSVGVTQTGALTVPGTATFNAGAGAITLTQPNNDFQGLVTLSNSGAGNAVAITDVNNISFTSMTLGGNFTVTAGGGTGQISLHDTTNSGTQTYNGNVVLNSTETSGGAFTVNGGLTVGSNSIIDTSAGNGNVTLTGIVDLDGSTLTINTGHTNTAGAIVMTNAGNNLSGALSLTGGNTSVTNAGPLTFDTSNIMGNLAANSHGMSQIGPITVSGTSNLQAGSGPITLTDPGNFFNGWVTSVGNPVNIVGLNPLAVPPAVPPTAPAFDPQTTAAVVAAVVSATTTATSTDNTYETSESPSSTSNVLGAMTLGTSAPVVAIAPTSSSQGASGQGRTQSSQGYAALAAVMEDLRKRKVSALDKAVRLLEQNPGIADLKTCAGGAGGDDCIAVRPGLEPPRGAQTQARPAPKVSHLPAIERKVALLIGINDYEGGIPKLASPVIDVQEIGNLYRDQLGYEVRTLLNADKASIVRELNRLILESGANDSITVMYAGHGHVVEKTQRGYWIPAKASADNPAQWISNNDIAKALENIPAKQIMLVSDSCYSGTLAKEAKIEKAEVLANTQQVLALRSVTVLSSGGEEPVPDQGRNGHSVFAWHFMQQLKNVNGVANGVNLSEQISEDVTADIPQTPRYGAGLSSGHQRGGDYLFEVRRIE